MPRNYAPNITKRLRLVTVQFGPIPNIVGCEVRGSPMKIARDAMHRDEFRCSDLLMCRCLNLRQILRGKPYKYIRQTAHTFNPKACTESPVYVLGCEMSRKGFQGLDGMEVTRLTLRTYSLQFPAYNTADSKTKIILGWGDCRSIF